MSLDLADLKRLKITEETRAWLTAESQTTGRSAQEIVRDVLHELALRKKRAAMVLLALSPAEGHGGDSQGQAGKR